MVTQQEIKSYKLLSSNSMQFCNLNDPGYKDMWYIVSATGYDFYCNAVPRNSGQIKLLLDSACWSNIFLFIYVTFVA